MSSLLLTSGGSVHEQFVAESKAAVGGLAAGVAHFFNNELCAIQLACALLRKAVSTSGTPVVSCLDDIDRCIRHGANITRRLLQYAEAKVLRRSQFDPSLLLKELVPALRATAGEKVQLTISHSTPISSVELDVDLLKEAVFATVQNARDAMPAGGKLTISLRPEELDAIRAEQINLVPGSFVSFIRYGHGIRNGR